MAISGSPGIPSCGVYIRGQWIFTLPYTQNKPKSVVEFDPDKAAQRILAGEIVQIDMRGRNFALVVEKTLRLSPLPLALRVA